MSTPLHALKPLAGRALETALNHALALDPDTRHALLPLHGRRVSLVLEAPPLALDISVHDGYLQVGPPLHEPDLAVRGTLGGLLGQLPFFADAARPRPAGRLHVSGDADLARRLQHLAAAFDPDWQQPFVAAFGEVIGVQVANAAAAALRGARRAAAGLARSGAEYLTEEAREVVAAAELSAFHDEVDMLRDDVERLAARVSRLAAARRAS